MKKNTLKNIFYALGSIVFWIGLWWLGSYIVGKEILLPSPIQAASALWGLMGTWEFWAACLSSLFRVFSGLILGIIGGVLLAAATLSSKLLKTLFSPLLTVIRATPVASFIILAFVWMSDETIPVFSSLLIILPVVWTTVCSAVQGIDRDIVEMARVFRIPVWRRLREIYIPCVLPYFARGFRTSLGMAWKAEVAAEVLCTPNSSIGTFLNASKVYLETSNMFAWTATVIILSMILEFVLGMALDKAAAKYTVKDKESENDHN